MQAWGDKDPIDYVNHTEIEEDVWYDHFAGTLDIYRGSGRVDHERLVVKQRLC